MDPEYAPVQGRKRPQRSQRTHREVADELRARIRSGELRPGQRMPTQAKLADEFGVERAAVRQALRILQSEQLLTNVAKGAPATVAGRPGGAPTGPGAPPQPTTAALAPRIAAAFEAEHVEIDAVCLTATSLTLAIGEPLRRIHAGRMKPAKVDVRVLLPGRNVDLAFPVAVGDPDDDRGGNRHDDRGDDPVHERWLSMRNAQGQVLRHNLRALRATHGIDVRVSFRALPFTPPMKLYLLNGVEAFFAYYTPSRSEAQIGQENIRTYDVQGTRSALFAFEQGAGTRDSAFVTQSRLWFDALWETISSELRLTG
ncbi:FadR/GntR family transcriptional regulator [Streptomyces sp. NBRC 110035]|uniref:FadR/GntR family transcriptional regulator n=1 Tax=Streptomyces sp. NBRC 110035 TaxID=1547867 RepID=UPI00099D7F7E|nr:GntR family transcriptional regulator [Streptomyces sp. NBRC 110035]